MNILGITGAIFRRRSLLFRRGNRARPDPRVEHVCFIYNPEEIPEVQVE